MRFSTHGLSGRRGKSCETPNRRVPMAPMTTPKPPHAAEGLRQRLLDRARAGDVAALGELFESYRPYIAFIARARGVKRLQAKAGESDLVQDVLILAHRAFAGFRGTTVEEF